MRYMRFKMACLASVAILASGCATIDMTEMATPVSKKTEAPSEKNVVIRAAEKLYAAFRSRGFVAKSSRKKMQSAASILLNGLEERELTTDEVDYAAQEHPRSVVIADINFASQQVERTRAAADVYYEMSEGDQKLKTELFSLEEALLSSREAANAFEAVIGADAVELIALNTEIDRLKIVTDKFGLRVRNAAAAEMAARRRETS